MTIQLVIQSHLSDASIEMGHPQLADTAELRIQFVKFLLNQFPDTNRKIKLSEIEELFETFNEARLTKLN
jgi:hypothetical protein